MFKFTNLREQRQRRGVASDLARQAALPVVRERAARALVEGEGLVGVAAAGGADDRGGGNCAEHFVSVAARLDGLRSSAAAAFLFRCMSRMSSVPRFRRR